MTTPELSASHPSLTEPYPDANPELDGLTVPYTGQTRMRLTITSGMADARVRIDPDANELIAIDCSEGTPPRLRVSASELRVSWPHATIGSWLRAALAGESRDIAIVLHPAVEWTLQIRGGLARFEADLASGKLARLEISGGVSDARLDLPPPTAVVPIRISGGASDLALRRPADTGVALAVSGGISDLRIDDQSFDAIGGALQPHHRARPRRRPPLLRRDQRWREQPARRSSSSLARRRSPCRDLAVRAGRWLVAVTVTPTRARVPDDGEERSPARTRDGFSGSGEPHSRARANAKARDR